MEDFTPVIEADWIESHPKLYAHTNDSLPLSLSVYMINKI